MNQALLAGLFRDARIAEALRAASAWTEADPASVLAWQYRGNAELWLGQPQAAEASYRHALALSPGLARSQANLALALMAMERYAEAWPLYECRYATELSAHDQVRFPFDPARQWHGEPLAGRRLLLVREQGFGDQIQFIRLASQLHPLGAGEVSLLCAPPLAGLLQGVAGIDCVLLEEPPAQDYDVWAPLLSLPLLLGMQAAPDTSFPYLHAPAGRLPFWRQQIDGWTQGRKCFGLAWAGSPGNAMNILRSLPLSDVFELIQARGSAMPISLQLGEAGIEDLAGQCQRGLVPLLDMLTDFSETAAAMQRLDLIITVDTAIAHLAAALGRPVWVLLPLSADWRWGRGGESSPWYPQARLFRQQTLGDWAPVIAEVKQALAAWAAA